MYTYLQQALPRVLIDRTLVETKKWKLPVRFSPTKENRMHQTKTSNKTDHDGFSPAVFRSRLEQTTPVTESVQLVEFVFFFYDETHVKNGKLFVPSSAAKVPLSQCSRVSLL